MSDNILIVFEAVSAAVQFGLKLQERLERGPVLDQNMQDTIKIGVQEGVFTMAVLHSATARAHYVGLSKCS